ncbi:MAG: phosphoribosylamine--glycine ligase, partial [Dialister sp.]|nr:phosphoribosylamine--glycine ligase [Dialister sp.]
MKVLVIGSGGREHALLWRLAQSPSVKETYVIPGNDGMRDVSHLIPVKGADDILDFARLMKVDLTIAGPETVLTDGLADRFEERGLPFFGPSKAAAEIEGSKIFAKKLMKKYKIPTADYAVFDDEGKAVSYVKKQKKYPLVIKADGLASG